MELFFKNLANSIEQAVKKDIEKILKEVGNERIYSVALVTDSDCITLYMAINTYEYMQKKDEQYKSNKQYMKMLKKSLSKEKMKSILDSTVSLTKWIPDEWGYSTGKGSNLVDISKILCEKEEALSTEERLQYRELFFEYVTFALKNLIELDIFGSNSEEITFFISVSDDENLTEIENYSAKLLNSSRLYEQFLKRTEFWKN